MSMPARAHARHAWLLLLVAAVPAIYGPLANLVSGEPLAAGAQFWQADPANEPAQTWAELVTEHPETATAIAGYNRMAAVFGLAYGLLLVAILSTAFRRGERWAWFAAWTYPAAIMGFAAVATFHDGWAEADSFAPPTIGVLIGIILLGLLLPIRIFFRNERQQHGIAGRADGA